MFISIVNKISNDDSNKISNDAQKWIIFIITKN